MTRLVFLFAPLALAACDGNISITGNGSDGEGNVSMTTGANGQVSIQAPGVAITTKLPNINLTAEEFDVNGLKLYPKSAIRELNVTGDNQLGKKDDSNVTVTFDAPASLATVQAWFRDNLKQQGFTTEATGNGFTGTTKDGDAFSLELTPDGEASTKGRMQVRG